MSQYQNNLAAIQRHLEPGEEIAASCFGLYRVGGKSDRTGVFCVTPTRAIFFRTTLFGYELETLDYSRVTSVEQSKGLLGANITLRMLGSEVSVRKINHGAPDDVMAFVRRAATDAATGLPHSSASAPVAPAATASASNPKASSTVGFVVLILLLGVGWWMMNYAGAVGGEEEQSGASPASFQPIDPPIDPPAYQAYQPTPHRAPLAVEPPRSARALRAGLRTLVSAGRRLPRENDARCGERMRALIERADAFEAQASMLPILEGGHITGPDGLMINEHLALGAAAGHARQCVTCAQDAIPQCDMASAYLRQ